MTPPPDNQLDTSTFTSPDGSLSDSKAMFEALEEALKRGQGEQVLDYLVTRLDQGPNFRERSNLRVALAGVKDRLGDHEGAATERRILADMALEDARPDYAAGFQAEVVMHLVNSGQLDEAAADVAVLRELLRAHHSLVGVEVEPGENRFGPRMSRVETGYVALTEYYRALVKEGRESEVRERLAWALESPVSDREQIILLLTLSWAEMRQGDYPLAIERAEKVMELASKHKFWPEAAGAARSKIILLISRDDDEEALEALEQMRTFVQEAEAANLPEEMVTGIQAQYQELVDAFNEEPDGEQS